MTKDQNGKAYLLCDSAFFRDISLGAWRPMADIPMFDRKKVGRRMEVEERRIAVKLLLLSLAQHPARYATMDNSDTTMAGKVISKVGMANVGSSKRRRRRKEAAVAETGEQIMYCCDDWVDKMAGDGDGFTAAAGMTVAAGSNAALLFVASLVAEVPPKEGATMEGVGKEYIRWEVVVDDDAESSFGKWKGGAMVMRDENESALCASRSGEERNFHLESPGFRTEIQNGEKRMTKKQFFYVIVQVGTYCPYFRNWR